MFRTVLLKTSLLSNVRYLTACRAALLVALFVGSVCSQAETPAPALFAGTVFNKLTGAPVRHAHVMYVKVAAKPAEAVQPSGVDTDPEGKFSVLTDAGSYRFWVEHPGYARQPYGSQTSQGAGSVLTLAPGAQVRDIKIKLTPLGAIAGTIFDENGDPVQGADVQVLRFSYATGQRTLIPVSGTSSDDRGHYRVYDLPAGRYLVLATPRGTPLLKPAISSELIPQTQASFAPLFYPGVVDPASASEISLPEGAEASGVEFRLPPIRALTVRGHVLMPVEDSGGIALQVILARNDINIASAAGRMSAVVNRAGLFEFSSVAPGSYTLVAIAHDRGHALSARMPLEVSPTAVLDNLTLSLAPAFSLAGRVEFEDGAASPMHAAISLVSIDHLAPKPSSAARVATDGNFHLPDVTPGPWSLSLDPLPQGYWIKSATYGDSDVSSGQLSIATDPSRFLRIVLAGNGGRISGRVTGPEDSAHAIVIVVPVAEEFRRSAAMYRVMSTGEHGLFDFKDLRPGAYKLFAFQEVEPFAWLDPEIMKPIESLGQAVTVNAGEHISRQLSAIPPDALLPER